jgi:PAS domain S-box-containing protein
MAEAVAASALRHPLAPRSRGSLIGAMLAVAAVYVVTARLGLIFAMADGVVTAIWPPAGVAIAGLLLCGFRVWPGVWLGSFIANLWGLLNQPEATFFWPEVLQAMAPATGSTVAALFSVGLLLHYERDRSPLATVNGVFRLVSIGLLGCVISASVGSGMLCATGHSDWAQFPILWMTWWAGDAVGVVVFAPMLLAWGRRDCLPMKARWWEAVAVLGLLAVVAGFVFLSGADAFFGGETHAFLCLPPLIWMALRLGSRGTGLGLVILAAFAVWGTAHETGPFAGVSSINNALLALDLFLAVSVIICLSVTAVAWMQREAAEGLREINRTLETRVAERTQNLQATADRLRNSRQQLQLAIQAASIGYWEFDPVTRTERHSANWSEQLGEAPVRDAIPFEAWMERLHPEDRERAVTVWEDYVAGRSSGYEQEFRLRHEDGSYRWIHSTGQYETRTDGQPRRILGCHIDITSRKKIESQWAALATLARQLNAATAINEAGQLIAGAADTLIGWDAAAIVLYDAESGWCRSVLNIDLVNGRRVNTPPTLDDRVPSPRLLRTLEHGAELLLRQEPLVFTPEHLSFGDTQRPSASLMYVPIRDSHHAVGILTIQSYRLNAYTPEDLVTLQTLADHCGGALARLRTEELRRLTEARLQEAQTIAQIGNFYWNTLANQVTWSEELFRIHGYARQQVQPAVETLVAAAHPEDRAALAAALQTVRETQSPLSHDYRIIRPDGSFRWLHLRARVVRNAELQIVGVEGTCQDITERKAITDSLALFRHLVDRVDDAIEVIEPETGRFLDVNTMACQELGYTRQELLALTVPDIDPEASAESMQAFVRELRAAAGSLTFESHHRRKNGSIFPVEISVRIVAVDRDYIVTVVRNISERKRTEAALRESQERLELAASAAHIGFWDWNLETNRVTFSPEWKAQIGYLPEELDDRYEVWYDRLHPEDRAAATSRITAYLEGRAPDYEVEFRLRHKDDSYRWIYTRGKLLRNEAGKPYRVLGGHVDITERKYAEMNLRESREQLRLLFETANDAILLATPGGHILSANRAACEMFQHSEAELRQIGRGGIVDPADDRLAVAVRARNETGSYRGELTFVRKDGSRFAGEVSTALMGGSGEQQIATVFVRDITKRKQLEAEQAHALSLLQATIESSSEGLLVVDQHGRITAHNRRFAELWHIPAPLLAAKDDAPVLNFVLEQLADPGEFLATVKHLYAHPRQESFDTLKFKDGRIYERYSRPQRLGDRIVGRVWSFRDVTEQRRAEAAVRNSEARLHLALEVSRMGSWDWDLQTNEVVADPRVGPLFGGPGTRGLVKESEYQKFIHPEDRATVTAAIREAVEHTNHYLAVFRVIWADQTVRWLEGCGMIFRDETGRPVRMVGVTADITERQQAEESLRRSQQQYMELVNNVDGIVWEADARTAAMTFVSSQAERILGYPVSAWTASATFWQDHLHPADRAEAIEFCVERTGLGLPYEFEYRMIAADGRVVWIRDLVKVAMENGVPSKLRGILLDVTTSKLADELAAGQSRALELIARSAPLNRTLAELCRTVEAQLPGSRCSVLLADEGHNRLVHGAAPSLPAEFCRAVDGLAIGPQSGCCGAAAYRRERVITRDIAADPHWLSYRDLALAHELRACASMPILDTHRHVIGTLAIYRSVPGEPTSHEWSVVESTTSTAAIAILKHQADEQLARSADILRQLSANLLETQEAERRHLARELHDEVGQTLTATKILLEGLQQQASAAVNADKRLADAIGCVNQLLNLVRDLSLSLRPPMLDDFGLSPALRWLLDQHTRTTGRPVTFDAGNFTHKPDPALETACFRIAQEALTNITRHSQAAQVSVALHSDADSFTLVVRDDGVGFDVAAARARALAGGSLGLLGQQERAALVGGRVEIDSAPGAGTEVRVWFPLSLGDNSSNL